MRRGRDDRALRVWERARLLVLGRRLQLRATISSSSTASVLDASWPAADAAAIAACVRRRPVASGCEEEVSPRQVRRRSDLPLQTERRGCALYTPRACACATSVSGRLQLPPGLRLSLSQARRTHLIVWKDLREPYWVVVCSCSCCRLQVVFLKASYGRFLYDVNSLPSSGCGEALLSVTCCKKQSVT